MKFNRKTFVKLNIIIMMFLFITCEGYEWCPINWYCGNYSLNFPLPTIIPCNEVNNPCNSKNGFNISIPTEYIEINGREVPSIPIQDTAYLSKIRTFMVQHGYNYSSKENYLIDNKCLGFRVIASKQMQPDKMWFIRYWKQLEVNSSKNLQITIIFKKINAKLSEDSAERILNEFHVEAKSYVL